MELDEPRSPVHEIFGYRRIKWKIKNYYAGRYCNNWIRSPIFCVYSPFLTKWQIGIKPSQKRHDMVAIYLQRVDHGVHRRFVRANWKFIFPHEDDQNEKKFEKDSPFETTEAMGIRIHKFSEYELGLLKTNLHFTIKCHIIVYDNVGSNDFEYYGGGCLKLLSEDLVLLYLLKKETDTYLYYGSEETINVHRAVLCCRNQVFKEMIKDLTVVDLNYPYEYLKGLDKVIRFLYSGDLKWVLKVPSFAIEKAAEYFKVEELKEYFMYDELPIETRIVVEEVQFTWRVHNVDKIERGCILSHRMRGLQNEVFRFVLYPRGISGKEDYMSLKIKLIRGVQPRNLCIYSAVYDVHNVMRDVKYWRWPPYIPGSMILNNIILTGRNILNNIFFDSGEIRLFFKFQKFRQEVFGPVNERYPVINKINNIKHYEKLSKDMLSLYTEDENGDLLVFTNNRNIIHQVHKTVLCCRSYMFSRLVENRVKIHLTHFDPEVIDVAFHYMYTGVLKENEPGILLKIFKFADSLGVQGLKNICARILETNLNVQNAVGTLIAAHHCKERSLKSAALTLIRTKFNEVRDQEHWQELINYFPQLYFQVIEFVSLVDNDEIEYEDFEIESLAF